MIGSLIIPICIFITNLFIRQAIRTNQTTGADMLLVILVFNTAIILNPNAFNLSIDKESITEIFLGLIFITLASWGYIVAHVEPKLTNTLKSPDSAPEIYVKERSAILYWIFGWILCTSIIGINIYFLTTDEKIIGFLELFN